MLIETIYVKESRRSGHMEISRYFSFGLDINKASTHYENGRHLFKEKLLKKITPLLLFVEEDFGTDIVNLGKFSASRL